MLRIPQISEFPMISDNFPEFCQNFDGILIRIKSNKIRMIRWLENRIFQAEVPEDEPHGGAAVFSVLAVLLRVERFDRRPIEPFELFTSEFGQNSVRIQENSSRIFRKFLKFEKFSTFSKVFSEIPRNFRQNRCKIR